MESYSPMEIMAEDIGLPQDPDKLTKYIKSKADDEKFVYGSEGNIMYTTDESGSCLILCLEDGKKEYYFAYDAKTELEAVAIEYIENIYGNKSGAIIVEDPEGSLFKMCAEIDFYNITEKMDLPSSVIMKIYAMALDITIFSDKEKFDSVVNKDPVALSPDGIPIMFGSKFMTPSGIMPESEDKSFPSFCYIHAEVSEVESKKHSYTGSEFFVLTCSSSIGDFELLCSPQYMNSNVKEGSVVVGYVLFRARILKAENSETGQD